MYQTRKFMRAGLSLAVLAAVSGLAIPHYAKATPVTALMFGSLFNANGTDIYDSPGVTGPATTLTTANWRYTCPIVTCAEYGLSGGGSEKVDAGVLGVQSHVSVSGTPPVNTFLAAGGIAYLFDNLTINGGSGSGVLLLAWTVDGSLSNSGGYDDSTGALGIFKDNTEAGIYSSLNGSSPSVGGDQFFGGPAGSPNVTVNFWVPFTFGTQFSISPNLSANAEFYPAYNTTPYTAETDFLDTAALTSALVYDGTMSSNGPSGSLVDDAIIQSGDGFSYGPDGLSVPSTAVPEPGELPWFALGLGLLGLIIARRRFPYRRQFPR